MSKSLDHTKGLPPVILPHILGFLPDADILRTSLVNREFAKATKELVRHRPPASKSEEYFKFIKCDLPNFSDQFQSLFKKVVKNKQLFQEFVKYKDSIPFDGSRTLKTLHALYLNERYGLDVPLGRKSRNNDKGLYFLLENLSVTKSVYRKGKYKDHIIEAYNSLLQYRAEDDSKQDGLSPLERKSARFFDLITNLYIIDDNVSTHSIFELLFINDIIKASDLPPLFAKHPRLEILPYRKHINSRQDGSKFPINLICELAVRGQPQPLEDLLKQNLDYATWPCLLQRYRSKQCIIFPLAHFANGSSYRDSTEAARQSLKRLLTLYPKLAQFPAARFTNLDGTKKTAYPLQIFKDICVDYFPARYRTREFDITPFIDLVVELPHLGQSPCTVMNNANGVTKTQYPLLHFDKLSIAKLLLENPELASLPTVNCKYPGGSELTEYAIYRIPFLRNIPAQSLSWAEIPARIAKGEDRKETHYFTYHHCDYANHGKTTELVELLIEQPKLANYPFKVIEDSNGVQTKFYPLNVLVDQAKAGNVKPLIELLKAKPEIADILLQQMPDISDFVTKGFFLSSQKIECFFSEALLFMGFHPTHKLIAHLGSRKYTPEPLEAAHKILSVDGVLKDKTVADKDLQSWLTVLYSNQGSTEPSLGIEKPPALELPASLANLMDTSDEGKRGTKRPTQKEPSGPDLKKRAVEEESSEEKPVILHTEKHRGTKRSPSPDSPPSSKKRAVAGFAR